MTDHLANNALSLTFGQSYARIPLRDSARILHADALEADWAAFLPPERCHYILGNPPFVGAKFQSADQRAQVRRIAGLGGTGGTLDFVAAWFVKAGEYVAGNRRVRIGFVSTNSISQGEQVAQLWPILFDRHGLEIAFAHRTFNWTSEARGGAHVHVVVIGLCHRDAEPEAKRLFSYPDIKGAPVETTHGSLTAYLFDARAVANRHLVVKEEGRPINGAPKLNIGSQIIDGGHFTFNDNERAELSSRHPAFAEALRPLIGADEYINGTQRWVLTLRDVEPSMMRSSDDVMTRVSAVRKFREASVRKSTLAAAKMPHRFALEQIPSGSFLVLPRVSSERREYAPFGWQSPPAVPTDAVIVLLDATIWHFGVLTSRAHMAWLRHIGGRLKSDFRYSIGLVYNTFPWPEATSAQVARVEALAQAVLDARLAHPTSSLADLYDPDTMPADLRGAHARLDGAVDRLYRPAAFATDRDRVEHLFGLYERMVDPLAREAARQNKRVARRAAAT